MSNFSNDNKLSDKILPLVYELEFLKKIVKNLSLTYFNLDNSIIIIIFAQNHTYMIMSKTSDNILKIYKYYVCNQFEIKRKRTENL